MKTANRLLAILALFFLFCVNARADITEGLIAYYPFNGNAVDETGNGNDGIVNGASPATDRYGNGDSAYYFNGHSDWVKIESDLTATTVIAWIKVEELPVTPSSNTIFFKGYGGWCDYQPFFAVHSQRFVDGTITDAPGTLYTSGDGCNATHGLSGPQLASDVWYQVVSIVGNGDQRLYLNGELILSAAYPHNNDSWSSSIGAANPDHTQTNFFSGWIDDVRVYNRALADWEIEAIYNSEAMPFDSDRDGIIDEDDQCSETEPEAIVNASGCSISEICPCDNNWKNHGAYVSCVAHAAKDFFFEGLINEEEKDTIVSTAGISRCGKKGQRKPCK